MLNCNLVRDYISIILFLILFQKLSSGFSFSYDESQIPDNKTKNRFQGYYPCMMRFFFYFFFVVVVVVAVVV